MNRRRKFLGIVPIAALAALPAMLGGCQLLLPAQMLCYPEPLGECLARHHPPAVPPATDPDKR